MNYLFCRFQGQSKSFREPAGSCQSMDIYNLMLINYNQDNVMMCQHHYFILILLSDSFLTSDCISLLFNDNDFYRNICCDLLIDFRLKERIWFRFMTHWQLMWNQYFLFQFLTHHAAIFRFYFKASFALHDLHYDHNPKSWFKLNWANLLKSDTKHWCPGITI